MNTEKPPCRKKTYKKVGYDLKLFVIDQIHNGRISINYAAKNTIFQDPLLTLR